MKEGGRERVDGMSAGPNVNLTPSKCNNIYIRARHGREGAGTSIGVRACLGNRRFHGVALYSTLAMYPRGRRSNRRSIR